MSSISSKLGQLFFLTISAAGGGLGVWQVQRYYWKVGTIDEAKSNFENSTVHLIQNSDNQQKLHEQFQQLIGNKARLSGKYIKDHDVFLGLRSAPLSKNRTAAQGLAVNPQGYYVYTPFQLSSSVTATGNSSSSSSSPIVFVNRGWIPMRGKEVYTPSGNVTIEGIVAKGEKVCLHYADSVCDTECIDHIYI